MFSVISPQSKYAKFQIILMILLYGLPISRSGNNAGCHFVNYKAKCSTTITKVPINVVIYFNVCHKPIDVTFTFSDRNNSINWKHTFVTTNLAETKSFDGFDKDVELHVVLLQNEQIITVKADLHVGGTKGLFIIDDSIRISDKTICNQSNNALVYQLVIIFSALLIFAISGTAILIYFHQKNKNLDNAYLTDNENPTGIPGSAPYQEGPNEANSSGIFNFLKKKFRRDLSVHYMRTSENNAMCIIENEYVQHPNNAS